jgi:glutaredoxin
MEFEKPLENGFTIYSKSGCPNCIKAKTLLKDKKLLFHIVDCDDYIIEVKTGFLKFIYELTNREIKTFPIIFHDGIFIGGFSETEELVDNLLLTFDEDCFF